MAGIAPAARIVRHSYTRGGLTSVWEATATGQTLYTYASQIAYHPNGLLESVLHGNGVSDSQTIVNGMARPDTIGTSGALDPLSATPDWTSEAYEYDGAGNIKKIGADTYRYDHSSRVLDGCVRGCTAATTQEYEYDAFGNLTKITTGGAARTISVDTATNRLWTGATYDDAGNVKTYLSGTTTLTYTWTPHGRMRRFQSSGGSLGGNDREVLYDGDGERVATIDYTSGPTAKQMTFTLRGLDEKVLREVQLSRSSTDPAGTMSVAAWSKDTVYGGGRLLATVAPNLGVRHLHLDHLGSVQLMTDAAGFTAGRHVYYPYGQEAPDAANQVQFDTQRMKFTGHERDTQRTLGANWGDDLDYMHARYYGAMVGRFMAVDPLRPVDLQLSDDAEERQRFAEFIRLPGNWNGYTYARNNPIEYVDPDGKNPVPAIARLATLAGGGAAALTAPAWLPAAAVGAVGTVAVCEAYRFGMSEPVSGPLTTAFATALDLTVFHAQNNRQTRDAIDGLVTIAQVHLGKIASAGGADNDPDRNHHKGEIKAYLERALRLARRLPKRQEEAVRQVIFKIAETAGVTL